MTLLLAMLLLGLVTQAAVLLSGGGWMVGFAIGTTVFVLFCLLASLLFAKLIGLDQRVHQTKEIPPAPKECFEK